jgi:hypothetical protein
MRCDNEWILTGRGGRDAIARKLFESKRVGTVLHREIQVLIDVATFVPIDEHREELLPRLEECSLLTRLGPKPHC